jgi:hypothetical protein
MINTSTKRKPAVQLTTLVHLVTNGLRSQNWLILNSKRAA